MPVAPPVLDVQSLIDSVKDYAIFTLTPEGYVATWNAGAHAIKGYTEREAVGLHISRFYTPEDVEAGKPARLLEIARRDGRVEDESWRVRKDGSRFWADVVISAIRSRSGEVQGFVKVTRDLTARRLAEESLRQAEERLRLMVDSVEDYAIFFLDRGGIVASWNTGAGRIKGWTASEIIGRHFSCFYTPEDVAAGKPGAELERAAATGRAEDEGWRVRKDGSRFWASVILSAVRDARGELLGFTKVTRDMTERLRADQELASRAREQAVIAELGQLALETRELERVEERALERAAGTLDADGALLFGGPGQATTARGLDPAGAEAVAAILAGADAAGTREGDERLLALGIASAAFAALVPVDGPSPRVLAVVSRAHRLFSRQELHFLEAVANVLATAEMRRAAEAKLRASEQRVELEKHAVKERDVFISVAAHELRTPLTALMLKLHGVATLLGREPEAPSITAASRRVQGAQRQAERLSDLVNRLLDVSHGMRERLALALDDVDLGAVAQQVADDFREQAASGRSVLSFGVDGDARGFWDRSRVEQVVINLLANAVKYGAGSPIDVHVDGRAPESVTLTVKDGGIGIPAQDLQRIFGRFERAVPLENFGGLGLGLYITRTIVDAHGGTIAVESAPGAGATFRVTLPRRVSPEAT